MCQMLFKKIRRFKKTIYIGIMGLLIKDLSKISGFSSARLRKWQERYDILNPTRAENGYQYYDADDLRILRVVQQGLDQGLRISDIVSPGRKFLLSKSKNNFENQKDELLKALIKADYEVLEKFLSEERKVHSLRGFIRNAIRPLLVLVGESWEQRKITVSREHEITRWVQLYLGTEIDLLPSIPADERKWLIAPYPGDDHELGAFMYYGILRSLKMPVHFAGMLREPHLIEELKSHNYKKLSVSVTMPKTKKEIEALRKHIIRYTGLSKVSFGGRGYPPTAS